MGVGDDGEGFGFAPRGDPIRRKAGPKTITTPDPPHQPSLPRAPYPAVLSGDHVPLSQRPPWVWLLIGILLGSGGTLLTSSFWLPESEGRRVAEALSDEVERDALTSGGPLENSETSASVLDSTVAEGDLGDDAAATTLVAALAVDARDGIEQEDKPRFDHGPDADTPKESVLEQQSEAIPPSERPTSFAELERPAETVTPSATAVIPSAEATAGIQEDNLPLPSPPFSRVEPLVALTQDVSRAASDSDSDPIENKAEVDPEEQPGQAELPPRIKQALQAANGVSETFSRLATDGDRLYRVQLAAFFSEEAARTYWREANQRLPGVFTDVEPIFDQRTVDERSYLRIWVGAFDSRVEADGYCGWLREQGQDCFVTRVDNL